MSRHEATHSDAVLEAVQSPNGAATSSIAASWCRSALRHGLDPARSGKRERVDDDAMAALREEHGELLTVAGPVLDHMFQAVGRNGCGVVLSDARGIILASRTTDADIQMFHDAGLVPGGRWSEAEEGTNGIGTCLVEDRPVVIHRNQHFASRNIGISCMDAPVHDPQGRLIAALDISSCRDDLSEAVAALVAALVQDAARRIEQDYFCRYFADARIIFGATDAISGTALLAVDRDDIVIGASRGARLRYRLTDAALARPRSVDDVLGIAVTPSLDDGERMVLRQALARAGGNASEAARMLGIGRATLYRWMKRSGLPRETRPS
jgi:transcriptional regulator of acetoin/glycerol metabolism